jgi:hypothetical protein
MKKGVKVMGDDLFDIAGLSIFASGGKWCTLNNAPCIPLSSCAEHRAHDRCIYESANPDMERDEE